MLKRDGFRCYATPTTGTGTNSANKVEATNSLLGQHTGALPHDLGLLGYLYLLDVLLNLERLPRLIDRR